MLTSNSQEAYHLWAKANGFTSMLPRDTEARRKQNEKRLAQSTLTSHLREKPPPPPPVVKYTDTLFRNAAVEWLIATDQVREPFFNVIADTEGLLQPIQALEHPVFRNMIDIAARATEGVKIPNRKQTRREIIDMFKCNMTKLRERLNVEHVSVHGLCKILIVILERYRERSGELDM